MASCLLHAKDIPTRFLEEVIYYSHYLLNLMSARAVIGMIPIKNGMVINHLSNTSKPLDVFLGRILVMKTERNQMQRSILPS